MKFRENEEAVSPVIGVILMVAITVILAAVIAAFVFGMSGNIQANKQVAATATATMDGGNKMISITYMGGQDAQLVKAINYTVDNGSTVDKGNITGCLNPHGNPTESISTGATYRMSRAAGTKDHVVVTAFFTDGSSQVILDTDYNHSFFRIGA